MQEILSLRAKLDTLRAELELRRSDLSLTAQRELSDVETMLECVEFVCFKGKRPAVIPEEMREMLEAAQRIIRSIRPSSKSAST